MDNKSSRRQFFTRAGQVLGIALIAPSVFSSSVFAEERRRPRPTEGAAAGGAAPGAGGGAGLSKPWVDVKSDQAKAVNYSLKHSDVKKAELKTERGGVAFDKQFCSGCTFFAAAGKKDGKDGGNCTVLSGNLVPADAWCASWSKKA